jgi:hypothetical protein
VIIATIFQLVFTKKGTQRIDQSYTMCEFTISEVVIQCVSILTACWPQLKPFLSWMQSKGPKTHDVEDPRPQSFEIKPLSYTSHNNLPLAQQEGVLFTTDWEMDSQLSQANTIIETEHRPWAADKDTRSTEISPHGLLFK